MTARVAAVGGIGLLSVAVWSAAATTPSFKRDIAPVLEERCSGCHLTGQEAGQLSLGAESSYASLVGRASVESALARVKPGDPGASYLLKKLEGTQLDSGGKGARMPLGEGPIDPRFLDVLRHWIASGAADD